jgi:moderate conductance mechanosensitive channel
MVSAVAPFSDITTWLRGSGLEIVLFVTGAILLSRFTRWVSDRITRRLEERTPLGTGQIRSEAAKHRHVVAQGVSWLLVVAIYCVAAALIVSRLGIPLGGLVAPAAVLGVALGFGAQRIVQDLLAGVFVIAERQYGFGDVIRIGTLGSEAGVTGTVEEVTLRITRLRTLQGEVVIVPNGQIVQVINMSRDWARAVVDVPVPIAVDLGHAQDILNDVAREARTDPDLGPMLLDAPSVLGVQSMAVDAVQVRVVARTLPGKQFDVGRDLRSRIAHAFPAEGITVSTALDTAEPVGTS